MIMMNILPEAYNLDYDLSIHEHFETSQAYDDLDLKGMIIPHHLIPVDKIAKMYKTASNSEVETIILLSPDHFASSNREILTSKKAWEGVFGKVYTDQKVIDQLLSLDFIYEDAEEIGMEHGLSSHIPFIAHYFENAKVVPLALNKVIKRSQLDDLLKVLGDDVFIIASVDFSHYYPKKEADQFDQETRRLMENGHYEIFFQMDDAYFDSPGVLYTVLTRANEFIIYDQGNSADYLGQNIQETTSYFFIGIQ